MRAIAKRLFMFFSSFRTKLYRFDHFTEASYNDFQMPNARYAIKYTCYFAIVYVIIFTVRDFQLVENKGTSLVLRLISMILLLLQFLVSKESIVQKKYVTALSSLLLSLFILNMFFIEYLVVGLPESFLPSSLILLAFVSNVGLGLPFGYSLAINLITLSSYFIYSIFISSERDFLMTQSLNLSLNFTLACVIGYLFERESRFNFHQRLKLSKANEELDKANFTKNRILTLLSHDLRAPMNNLAAILNLNSKELISKKEFNEFTDSIKLNLDATSNLLTNLIYWSKSQMDGFVPQKSTLNAKQLIEEVISDLGSIPDSKQISIHTKIEPSAFCLADKEMLKAAVRNIITNSIKFSAPHKNIWISAVTQGNHLAIQVKDEGIGISEEDQSKLFTQKIISKLGTAQEKGSGIGLQLSYDFIKLNNGDIKVSSTLNIGSTFTIYLQSDSNQKPVNTIGKV